MRSAAASARRARCRSSRACDPGRGIVRRRADRLPARAPGVPLFEAMAAMALLGLAANGTCLALLWKHRAEDVNMASVWECSRNDIASNLAVLPPRPAFAWPAPAGPTSSSGRCSRRCSCARGCACCAPRSPRFGPRPPGPPRRMIRFSTSATSTSRSERMRSPGLEPDYPLDLGPDLRGFAGKADAARARRRYQQDALAARRLDAALRRAGGAAARLPGGRGARQSRVLRRLVRRRARRVLAARWTA